jgi:plasmid maintenance system killer protein
LDLVFLDETLRRLAAEPDFRPEGWDSAEVRHVRRVAQCAQAAKVAEDLHALRILRIQPDPEGQHGMSSIQLSGRRRLLLTFTTNGNPAGVALSVAPIDVLSKEMEPSR